MKYTLWRLQLSLAVFLLPVVVWGQSGACEAGKLCNPLKENDLMGLVTFLVKDILVEIIAPIAITVMLLWTGFMFITAQGNDTKLADAKRSFFFVILGAIILLGAYVILEVVTGTVSQIVG